jgi:hypothetical protein
MDWHAWHTDYDADTPLARRLILVQARIREALAASPAGPIRVLGMCCGDGRDILGAVGGQPAAARIRGRLVELDADLAARARALAARIASGLEVVTADAGWTDAFAGAIPADIVLACGVFGNISDADVEGTVRHLPMLVGPGGSVIWTRHRHEPDLTPAVRGWFVAAGFSELSFETVPDSFASVGVHRLVGPALPFASGIRLFEFTRTA